jgi:hypothetical protein
MLGEQRFWCFLVLSCTAVLLAWQAGCRRPLAPYVVKELLGEAGYAR